MRLRWQNNSGFTLIETVVVIAIVSVITFAIFELYINFNRSYQVQNAAINNAYSAGAVVNDIQRLSLQSRAIISSKTVSGINFTTGSSTLILEIPSIDSSGDTIANKYDYAVFYLSSSTVYRIMSPDVSSVRASSTKMLTDVAYSFALSYNNIVPASATQLSIDIVTQTQVKQQTLQSHLTQQVYLRNI